jgi:hypothetical protein
MSLKLGSPSGGVKAKVVLLSFVEDSSGLASCPNMIDALVSFSIVLPLLVPSKTILAR